MTPTKTPAKASTTTAPRRRQHPQRRATTRPKRGPIPKGPVERHIYLEQTRPGAKATYTRFGDGVIAYDRQEDRLMMEFQAGSQTITRVFEVTGVTPSGHGTVAVEGTDGVHEYTAHLSPVPK